MGRELRGFYFITDSGLTENGVVEDVRLALAAGVAVVQYRDKNKSMTEMEREARELLSMCRRAGVPFLINDRVDFAKKISADGVHLGQEDMACREARKILGPDAVIGVSTGDAEEAVRAVEDGADYVAIGSVYPTGTKPDAGVAVGIETVRAVRAAVDVPLAAIGGIRKEHAPELIDAGVDLICAISASLEGGRVIENVRELWPAQKV